MSSQIRVFRCRLVDGEWRRIERHNTGRGFALMSEATRICRGPKRADVADVRLVE
jgi:hypothetical protein